MRNNVLAMMLVLAGWPGIVRATEVSEDAQKLSGIRTAALAEISLPPSTAVFGTVLSPAAVVDLIRQTDMARAALEVSQETQDRAEKLFTSGELVPRKDVQAARAQVALDKAALLGLEDRLTLEWGPWFSGKSIEDRDKLIAQFLAGKQSLVRLSVPRAAAAPAKPTGVRLHAFGEKATVLRSQVIVPAQSVDPVFQGLSFIAVLDGEDAPLAVGLSLTGELELEGKSRAGLLVPGEAVVFYLGKAWVYQKSAATDFERVEIPMDSPVAGGWFVKADAEIPREVVISGVQSILSQETLGPAEEE